MENVWAIILAGGKGSRMNAQDVNKVAMKVAGVPLLVHTVQNLKKAHIANICIVVGFAKDSVTQLFSEDIVFAEQKEQLGTGHAAKIGFEVISPTEDVFILYGDDSYSYTPEIYTHLYERHKESSADMTFLTLKTDNPSGLGRVVRDENNAVIGIVEEKDATEEQKKITEINPACYIFSYDFLKKNIAEIPKSNITGEYYLTYLVEQAVSQGVTIATYTDDTVIWRGVNTPSELDTANQMFNS